MWGAESDAQTHTTMKSWSSFQLLIGTLVTLQLPHQKKSNFSSSPFRRCHKIGALICHWCWCADYWCVDLLMLMLMLLIWLIINRWCADAEEACDDADAEADVADATTRVEAHQVRTKQSFRTGVNGAHCLRIGGQRDILTISFIFLIIQGFS